MLAAAGAADPSSATCVTLLVDALSPSCRCALSMRPGDATCRHEQSTRTVDPRPPGHPICSHRPRDGEDSTGRGRRGDGRRKSVSHARGRTAASLLAILAARPNSTGTPRTASISSDEPQVVVPRRVSRRSRKSRKTAITGSSAGAHASPASGIDDDLQEFDRGAAVDADQRHTTERGPIPDQPPELVAGMHRHERDVADIA